MSTFFTADLHFGHTNVIRYAGRPFADADEMDATLIERWNATVSPADTVYVVGDVALCGRPRALAAVRRLHGQKFLVRGNHDGGVTGELAACFGWIKDLATVRVDDADAPDGTQRIVLCHYAMRVWEGSHHGTWHLYGHSHGSLPDDPAARSLDVGVDVWDFRPVPYATIKARMAEKRFVPVDHHGARE